MKTRTLLFEDQPAGMRPTSGRPLLRGVLAVVLIFLGTRLLVWTATYCGATMLFRIEQGLDPPFEKHLRNLQEQGVRREGPAYETFCGLFLDLAPLCRFDGVHYRSIITGGYHYEVPPPGTHDRRRLEQNIAFFPLYPLTCLPLTGLMSANQAMVLVTHVCALLAGLILYLWVRWRIDEPTALWSVAYTFCLPPAVYYGYAYAEGLALLLLTAALALMDLRRFWAAAVVCGLATAVRPTALAIALVLVLAYWVNRTELPRLPRLARLIPLGVVGVLGIVAYAAFLTYEFGSPLVYIQNFKAGWVPDKQRADWLGYLTLAPVWEQFKYFRELVMFAPPIGLVNAANTLMWNMPLTLFLIFLSVGGMTRVPRSFRPLLALGPLIFLHSYLASGGAKFGIEPIARYMAVAVPALIVLAAWSLREWKPVGRFVLLTFFLLIQTAWALRFGLQEWSG